MRSRLPRLTSCVLAVAAIVSMWPSAAERLLYDRERILDGEVWRLVTGHLVHFTTSHFVLDAIALGLAGWAIERTPDGMRRVAALYATSAIGIGLTLLVAAPRLDVFGGLSGVAYAAIAVATFDGLRNERLRPYAIVAAVMVLAKMVIELGSGDMLMVDAGTSGIIAVPLSHLAGAVFGLTELISRTGVEWRCGVRDH